MSCMQTANDRLTYVLVLLMYKLRNACMRIREPKGLLPSLLGEPALNFATGHSPLCLNHSAHTIRPFSSTSSCTICRSEG
jgi:hypothetical protein